MIVFIADQIGQARSAWQLEASQAERSAVDWRTACPLGQAANRHRFIFFKAILSRGIGHRAWLAAWIVSVQLGLAQPVDDEPWVRITARTEFRIESREVTVDSVFEKHLSKQGGVATRPPKN